MGERLLAYICSNSLGSCGMPVHAQWGRLVGSGRGCQSFLTPKVFVCVWLAVRPPCICLSDVLETCIGCMVSHRKRWRSVVSCIVVFTHSSWCFIAHGITSA